MSSVALLGIALDNNSSFLRGPRHAPHAIREALGSPHWHAEAETGFLVGPESVDDLGDIVSEDIAEVAVAVRPYLRSGRRLLSLGGDHSISIPLIAEHAAVHGPLTVVYIDAHPDLYDSYDGSSISHACVCARVLEAGHAKRMVQIGIRTLNQHQRDQARRFGVEIRDIDATEHAPLELEPPVYVSVDVDAVDPGFAPGVSHVEPGGLTPREVIRVIHGLSVPLVGTDLVELNPDYDPTGVSAFVAAKLARELLAALANSPGSRN